jgi:hypothetical protein
MKIKIILILFLIPIIAFAQKSRFSEGETIYVWALSGLNMRKLPDAKSEKISSLPYGTKVTVQANIGVIVAHEVEEFKDFKVKGVWLLVKYGDKEGFVFDGYMSRLVAPRKVDTDTYHMHGLLDYVAKSIGKIGKIEFISTDGKKGKLAIKYEDFREAKDFGNYKINFKDGIYYQLENISEGNEEILTFPNLSLYEGYIFIKTFFSNFDYQYDKTTKAFALDDNETCTFEVFMKKKNLIIIGGCNC